MLNLLYVPVCLVKDTGALVELPHFFHVANTEAEALKKGVASRCIVWDDNVELVGVNAVVVCRGHKTVVMFIPKNKKALCQGN